MSIQQISLIVFGTQDYHAMLEILPPYDGAVKRFWKLVQEQELLGHVE